MHYHHMMELASENMATRRAEADRARLARVAHADTEPGRSATGPRPPRRPGVSLGAFLHRVAHF